MEEEADGGLAVKGKERKPRPGPDNEELSGLGRGVGDISQIRTDHKPLDAIQFCGATIRRLIMCHPSIRPPPCCCLPSHKSTRDKLMFSPPNTPSLGYLPPLASVFATLSVVACREEIKKGTGRRTGSECKDGTTSDRDLIDDVFRELVSLTSQSSAKSVSIWVYLGQYSVYEL